MSNICFPRWILKLKNRLFFYEATLQHQTIKTKQYDYRYWEKKKKN